MKKLILLLLLLFPTLAHSAGWVRYVNTASAGGDGTTNETAGATAAFTHLKTAVDTMKGTLTDPCTIYCYGVAADTIPVVIDGFSCGTTRYLLIQGDNNIGKTSTSYYRLSGSFVSNYGAVISISDQYIFLKNIEITNFRTSDSDNCSGITVQDGGEYSILDGCIVHDNNTSTYYTLNGINVDCSNANNGVTVRNCIVYNLTGLYSGKYGLSISYNYGSYIYNNTISSITPSGAAAGIGIRALNYGGSLHPLLKNNLSYNNKTSDYSGTFSTSSTNNLSKDGTAPAYNVYYTTKTITFVDASGGDFHLVATDTDAIGKGTDLSSIFTTDIDGDTRTVPWDIGADMYISEPSFVPRFLRFRGKLKLQ